MITKIRAGVGGASVSAKPKKISNFAEVRSALNGTTLKSASGIKANKVK